MKNFKSHIDHNGRLAIPAKVRKQLHLNAGDKVAVSYSESALIISTFHAKIEKARKILAQYEGLNLQQELKSMRQEDEH